MEKNNHIPIFLSFSKPVFPAQQEFIQNLSDGIEKFGMRPRTLGVTDYDIGVPLIAIKTLMSNSAGLISVAFRRTHIETGDKFDTSDGRAGRKEPIRDKWLTSPWPHIEAGMAFQIDLPILILRESGVVADGILEKGSSAFYLPTFDLDSSAQSYLYSAEWQHIFHKWSRQVSTLAKTRDFSTAENDAPQDWSFLRPPTIVPIVQGQPPSRPDLLPALAKREQTSGPAKEIKPLGWRTARAQAASDEGIQKPRGPDLVESAYPGIVPNQAIEATPTLSRKLVVTDDPPSSTQIPRPLLDGLKAKHTTQFAGDRIVIDHMFVIDPPWTEPIVKYLRWTDASGWGTSEWDTRLHILKNEVNLHIMGMELL